MKPPGVPPSEIADSAIGVIPGPMVGVRSTELSPGNFICDWIEGVSNEVMTLSDEFLVVILPGF